MLLVHQAGSVKVGEVVRYAAIRRHEVNNHRLIHESGIR